jgi:hypothetical protein
VVLGVILLAQMPASSVWFIGFAIGVDMIVEAASLVGFATAIHSLPGLQSCVSSPNVNSTLAPVRVLPGGYSWKECWLWSLTTNQKRMNV